MFDKRILTTVPLAALFPAEIVWYEQDVHYGQVLRASRAPPRPRWRRRGRSTCSRSATATSARPWRRPADRVAMLHTIPIRRKRCVEVGVARGRFAREILAMQPASLLLVDPWRHQGDDVYPDDPCNVSNSRFEEWYEEVRSTLGCSERVTIARDLARGGGARCARHARLRLRRRDPHRGGGRQGPARWWPKLKAGGWLTGHDYQMEPVQRAVAAFCAEHSVELGFVTLDDAAELGDPGADVSRRGRAS